MFGRPGVVSINFEYFMAYEPYVNGVSHLKFV